MGSAIKKVIPIAAAVVGNTIAPGIGGAIGSAVGTKATGGSWGDAALAGAGSWVGGNIAKNYFPGGGTIGQSIGKGLGSSVANALPASIASAGMNEAIGSYAGSNIAQSFGGKSKTPSMGGGEPAFTPKEKKLTLPGSLAMGGYSPDQQSSKIATQGVYGGGAGRDEEKYFLDLINNRLVDKGSNMGELNAIESSYISQLGLGGYNNPKDLLRAISKRSYA
jgi:hypothetical protein